MSKPSGQAGEFADSIFVPASFQTQLGLPDEAHSDQRIRDAARAVQQEFVDCSKWKKLRCRKISVLAESDRGVICILHVGRSIEFDWTWEGAIAFRPASLEGRAAFDDFDLKQESDSAHVLWSGEIVEVDEQNGCLFVSLAHPESIPTAGSFFVRPFEFLAVLNSIYNDDVFERIRDAIPLRLTAAAGGIHPIVQCNRASDSEPIGLDELTEWWQHSWSILWGSPGTGKTYTTGQQIAKVLNDDPTERVLVVSTTNRATDAVSVSIGTGSKTYCPELLGQNRLRRIGKGASYQRFSACGLSALLSGTESESLQRIARLTSQLRRLELRDEKAMVRKQIGELRSSCADQSRTVFVDPDVQVVVATAFKAMTFFRLDSIRAMLETGESPFTTIFIDEAGLIPRATIAALSLFAARRVVLVGDSKQLAPISRISRVIPTRQATWLASSGLSHLDDIDSTPPAVQVLTEQYRMHSDVCEVVSQYQYGGMLTTAEPAKTRPSQLPSSIASFSRAIWYVLDEEETELAAIRARRGPGNKSWVRSITPDILAKLFSDEKVKQSNGLFISPFRAQAQAIASLFAKWNLKNWEASTVHSQQGAESDIVIFDTVNAGSCAWPVQEWKRLVNVALSRAREAVILLASRGEIDEPYLRPLVGSLTPGVIRNDGSELRWHRVGSTPQMAVQEPGANFYAIGRNRDGTRSEIGHQIADRKSQSPLLSHEQQRLSNLDLDGKPRLVRGVAGSGKSIVLANWLAKTARKYYERRDFRIWGVYANRSLHKLLQDSIESAWKHQQNGMLFGQDEFPWQSVSLLHVKDVLSVILPRHQVAQLNADFNYDRAAGEFLNSRDGELLDARCDAMFIDEAQDMGPSTLRLLLSLVKQTDSSDLNSRPAHIFYDNAQNLYGCGTPKWSDFGLDLRGRSTIMRESFRSTNPITELAINVQDRLAGESLSVEKNELLSLGLIEKTTRNQQPWFRVRFNQVQGPKPIFNRFEAVADEMDAIGRHLIHLIAAEDVSPTDICIIYNGSVALEQIQSMVAPMLVNLDVELSHQKSGAFQRKPNTIVVTTPHSFKGYEAEVVLIPRADRYVTADNIVLANNLYVAMTRARSLLAIYSQAVKSHFNPASHAINAALESCIAALHSTSNVEDAVSRQDDFIDVLDIIGHQHRSWLRQIWSTHEITQEPIFDSENKIVAEPLFWYLKDGTIRACFSPDSTPVTGEYIRLVQAGEMVTLEVGGS